MVDCETDYDHKMVVDDCERKNEIVERNDDKMIISSFSKIKIKFQLFSLLSILPSLI